MVVFLYSALACPGQTVPPANDDYTNAMVLTGNDISFAGTLAGATREYDPYEVVPNYLSGSTTQTVWWTWTASESDTANLQVLNPSKETHGSDGVAFYTLENIYTGQNIAQMVIETRFPQLFFVFQVLAGTNYHIQLAGNDSANFSMRLVATNLPLVIAHPQSQTVTAGDSVLFTVVAAGNKPFSYQWQYNGTNLPGETAPMLALDGVATDQAGPYRVVITNSAGTTYSDTATLHVTPADTAPLLTAMPPMGAGEFTFGLLGDVGRRYRIESSTNLSGWSAEASFPRTTFYDAYQSQPPARSVVFDSTGGDRFTLSLTQPQKFFRAHSFHAVNEICNNNIKQIRFAQLLFAYDHAHDPSQVVSHADLLPYLKNGAFPQCPSNGYYTVTSVLANPWCSTGYHPFEEP